MTNEETCQTCGSHVECVNGQLRLNGQLLHFATDLNAKCFSSPPPDCSVASLGSKCGDVTPTRQFITDADILRNIKP